MDLTGLKNNYHLLIEYLKSADYSRIHIQRTEHAIRFLLDHMDNNWHSYDDAYSAYCKACNTTSSHMKIKRKIHINIIYNFDVFGLYPEDSYRKSVDSVKTFADKLYASFADALNNYQDFNGRSQISEDTAHDRYLIASSLLYKLQEKGCKSLKDLSETAVVETFANNGHPLSYPYKSIMRQLLLLQYEDIEDVELIRYLSFIPKNRSVHKTKEYLSKDDCVAIHGIIHDNDSQLSLRDRAIGALLFYTGMRAVDISKLLIESVDFDNDVISITQSKTSSPLVLPLRASYGNLLYDYIETERPNIDTPYVFLGSKAPYKRLKEKSISSTVVNKLFNAADIRMDNDDARGSHIFRRNVTGTMLANNVSNAVISSVLGHESPDSINPYLGADFVHLKDCALSLEKYPVNEEVFNIW